MSYLPVTVDGSEIPTDAPRSQGMSDQLAADLSAKAEEYRQAVMHLHADVTGLDVTLTAANCDDGQILFVFGDGAADVSERVEGGATPTVTHTYPRYGVFTAQLLHERGDRATLELILPDPTVPPPIQSPEA